MEYYMETSGHNIAAALRYLPQFVTAWTRPGLAQNRLNLSIQKGVEQLHTKLQSE